MSVVIGGIIGAFFWKYLSLDFKEKLNMVFGACALVMGISSITLLKNLPAVILAVVMYE